MEVRIRVILEMVVRVLQFCRAHLVDLPAFVEALAELERKYGEAVTLTTRQQTGFLEARAARRARSELRRRAHRQYLKPMVAIARVTPELAAALAPRFVLPAINLSLPAYLAGARAMLEQARPHREVFVGQGLPATFVEDLEALLAEVARAQDDGIGGQSEHVGAREELRTVAGELVRLATRLDVINRLRFAEGSEEAASWRSARDVRYRVRREADEAPGTAA